VRAFADWLDGKKELAATWTRDRRWMDRFVDGMNAAIKEQPPKNVASWRALQGRLGVIKRLRMFDEPGSGVGQLKLVEPGHVSIFDLSEMESPYQRNLAIAEVLRLVQMQQEKAFNQAIETGASPPRTLVIIEEAHEFISAERIRQMPILFNQIARIARRGRKRRLGLCFVSQSPQHLPREILGLVNNVILHRLTDAAVIRDLRQAFGAVDDGLWRQLGNLAPGQAVVSFTSISQPLLVAMDPTPVKLRLID
jgi:DNA helicase HerA-like ATPase